jgi:hypothetical protein
MTLLFINHLIVILHQIALKSLRNGKYVQEELEHIKNELDLIESKQKSISYIGIVFNKKYRQPLLTSILLHLIQQSCAFYIV